MGGIVGGCTKKKTGGVAGHPAVQLPVRKNTGVPGRHGQSIGIRSLRNGAARVRSAALAYTSTRRVIKNIRPTGRMTGYWIT